MTAETKIEFEIGPAVIGDVDELLKLYFTVYGNNYPLAYGTDAKVMADAIQSNEHVWLVTREKSSRKIVGSVVFELDPLNKVAKIVALVTHPNFRTHRLGSRMIESQTTELLGPKGAMNSVYATTRTVSIGVQLIFVRLGFLTLGIFPNAHKLREYETTTLFAKFRDGVLARRDPSVAIPAKLGPIYAVLGDQITALGIPAPKPRTLPPTVAPGKPPAYYGDASEFEVVDAPEFVKRQYLATFTDPYDRFYPFHQPNRLVASRDGKTEVYAHFSRPDRYCAILTLNAPIHAIGHRIPSLLSALRDHGASYFEVLIGVQHQKSIETLMQHRFLPSAIYPAMTESEGKLHDFVVMSRSMEPLNFQGMTIDHSLKPYVDQYVELWKKMHLDSLEIFDE
ncbi:MAG: hypothetical protein JST04_11655 [Bdellovibrionales bacterium]|nr:hypothetical protein [Bdellovibrionales bacterium]